MVESPVWVYGLWELENILGENECEQTKKALWQFENSVGVGNFPKPKNAAASFFLFSSSRTEIEASHKQMQNIV